MPREGHDKAAAGHRVDDHGDVALVDVGAVKGDGRGQLVVERRGGGLEAKDGVHLLDVVGGRVVPVDGGRGGEVEQVAALCVDDILVDAVKVDLSHLGAGDAGVAADGDRIEEGCDRAVAEQRLALAPLRVQVGEHRLELEEAHAHDPLDGVRLRCDDVRAILQADAQQAPNGGRREASTAHDILVEVEARDKAGCVGLGVGV